MSEQDALISDLRAIARLTAELKSELAWLDEGSLHGKLAPSSGTEEVPVRSSEVSRPTESMALSASGQAVRASHKRAANHVAKAVDRLLDARADLASIFRQIDAAHHPVVRESSGGKLGKAEMRRLKAAQKRRMDRGER